MRLFDKYFTPLVQVILLGLVCLCCPGMYNALSGLGAGGSMSSNVGLIDSANGALYGCFAIVGFFSGTFTNTVGVKRTLTVKKNFFSTCFFFGINNLWGIDWFTWLCYLFCFFMGL